MRFAHLTLGKAGSQWVKDVLTDPQIFAAQDVHFVQPRGGYEMSSFALEPDGTFVAPAFHVTHAAWHAFSAPDDRCIVVLRDPRDSIVSWAFSVAYSHVTEEHVSIVRPAMLALDLKGKIEIAMYTFWESANVQRSWAGVAPTERERVFAYEEIVADELAAFRAMVDHFGWAVDDADLREVVDRLSFANRSGGRGRGVKNAFSHYRNGVPGDWVHYFDRDLAERFERAMPGLVRELGYERDDDWWRARPELIPELARGAALAADEADAVSAELARTRAALDAANGAVDRLLRGYDELAAIERELDALRSRLAPAPER